ncbi:hypothetical protein [Flavobacterium gawalongense]|uniref:Uncharacterized protein n=1 Tax=Flavobacterium gawalongense TaxID=2594432 RepID=A0A553BNX5_9FLAO|nr:hypothetical protein [Flavobacterium gawalongense]TRW99981.1 hypothetical protein FNW33_14030 [Flavobacterium gawalongense]TRX04394.1 hypothetical protein FNW12_13535 [Flavobacterium gawalongense]TRX08259.1 hypothetical protein FNW10_13375 [Flavobacterium gawalongense]TRX09947.1 hypothetical protein FNW11_08520 [Flavobacterium gawalongense]TRX24325.1 hypothetical protein FNW38_13475 [Flavobacterium gawalongense]
MIKQITGLFDKHVLFWENPKIIKTISTFLVVIFIACGVCSFLVSQKIISLGHFNSLFKHRFFAVEVVFTILLIFELLSLIFVLPKSVTRSLGKQFELLSMIFLRDAFKEFSHLDEFVLWSDSSKSIINILVYSFGALTIFTIMGFTRKLNREIQLSETYINQFQFVRIKKMLAIFLLLSFFYIGFNDFITLLQTGVFLHSFETFYTALIFTDIVIVLVSLRFTTNYYRVFRYSAFVLATILIRISLTLEPCYNVILGIITTLFVFTLAKVYHYFQKWLTHRELTT